MAEREEPQMLGYSSDSESDASEIASSNSGKDTGFCIPLCMSKDSVVAHLDHTMTPPPHFPDGVFIMPILLYHQTSVPLADNKDYGIVGLILAPTDTKRQKGQYKHVGVFEIDGDDTACCELLWALGLQQQQDERDRGELFYERKDVEGEGIKLDDVVPDKWYGKNLDFIPKVFTCYDINVV